MSYCQGPHALISEVRLSCYLYMEVKGQGDLPRLAALFQPEVEAGLVCGAGEGGWAGPKGEEAELLTSESDVTQKAGRPWGMQGVTV